MDPTQSDDRPFPKNGTSLALFLGALISVVLIGAALASAAGDGGWLSHHRGGHGHAWGGTRDPETARAHAEAGAEWVLRYVDASEEQREQMKSIIADTIDELFPLGERHRANRDALVALLRQPEIDRDALERLRRDELALADRASAQLAVALADAADVLTPDQRAELLDLADTFRRFRRH